jgi:hypothetical protein
MKQALEMSIDEYTVNVYEGLVAQARATPSIFFAKPNYKVPEKRQIVIFGIGAVDLVDDYKRRHQGSFGVYIKELGLDDSSRPAYIHPGSMPIDDAKARRGLIALARLLKEAMEGDNVEFGLRGSYGALA